jgi:hypothetical protein
MKIEEGAVDSNINSEKISSTEEEKKKAVEEKKG